MTLLEQAGTNAADIIITIERQPRARFVADFSAARKSPTRAAHTSFLADVGALAARTPPRSRPASCPASESTSTSARRRRVRRRTTTGTPPAPGSRPPVVTSG